MNHHRITLAATHVLLGGCSNAPTTPAGDTSQQANPTTSVRASAESVSASGNMFGSGTITADPTMDASMSDSSQTAIARAGVGFGSGT